jgi:hypothetical protein
MSGIEEKVPRLGEGLVGGAFDNLSWSSTISSYGSSSTSSPPKSRRYDLIIKCLFRGRCGCSVKKMLRNNFHFNTVNFVCMAILNNSYFPTELVELYKAMIGVRQ